MEDTDVNTIRILIATDLHLGFMENDPLRGNDSFETLEEICSLSEKLKVDFLLLGGNLFDQNCPSPTIVGKAIRILRQYFSSKGQDTFQVVSDQNSDLHNRIAPVFSIHGNHDEPVPASKGSISVMEILSQIDYLRYFGNTVISGPGVGCIKIDPLLIKKGSTAVALYGLGHIRDETLHMMFKEGAVNWIQPESQEGDQVSDWFKILILHQNRDAEMVDFLPDSLDFVVWGHEHECLIDPQEVRGKRFCISQPGSTIATSLSEEESKPKHVLLLEIKGNQYFPTKIPLRTVRPFEYIKIILKDAVDINSNDDSSILQHLDDVVRKLLEKHHNEAVSGAEPKLPLIHVMVDNSGCNLHEPYNGNWKKYAGKVANPESIFKYSETVVEENILQDLTIENVMAAMEATNLPEGPFSVHDFNKILKLLMDDEEEKALEYFTNKIDEKLAIRED